MTGSKEVSKQEREEREERKGKEKGKRKGKERKGHITLYYTQLNFTILRAV